MLHGTNGFVKYSRLLAIE